jgi:hypothetical protein
MMVNESSDNKKEVHTPADGKITSESPESSKPVKLNRFGRAFFATAIGVAIGIVELILFSAAAGYFGVAINLATMPLNWQVGFYTLCVLPGLCFVYAFLYTFG